MTRRADVSLITVIRDPDASMPLDLLHPHYDDSRFRERNIGRVVFLAPGVCLDETGKVEGADYMDSTGYALWHAFADFSATPEAQELTPRSANFFEAALNELWPRLGKHCSGIVKFGREIPGVQLQAITSGINGFNLYAFNEFAVVPRS